jgi:hypothetical protein
MNILSSKIKHHAFFQNLKMKQSKASSQAAELSDAQKMAYSQKSKRNNSFE